LNEDPQLYYYGLASPRQLAARSNAVTKKLPLQYEDQHPIRKYLGSVGEYACLEAAKGLTSAVMAVLDARLEGWVCIDVVRICEDKFEPTSHIILWEGVLPGATRHKSEYV
jgi:hypothetical protein